MNLSRSLVALGTLIASVGCSPARVSSDARSDASAAHAPPSEAGSTNHIEPSTAPLPSSSSRVEKDAQEPTAETNPQTDSPRKENEPHCVALPLNRPKDVSIRFTRIILPIAGPMTQEGIELHAETECPMTSGPRADLPKIPCRRITPKELDTVYADLVHSGFSQLKAKKNAYGSPHYGSRTISVYWQNDSCEIDDSSDHMLVKPSADVFYRLSGVIVSAGAP